MKYNLGVELGLRLFENTTENIARSFTEILIACTQEYYTSKFKNKNTTVYRFSNS